MKSKDRFVFDTSVLVSAVLIEDSHPTQAFRKARQVGEILLSLPTAEELNEVMGREKFNRYLSAEDRERFVAALIQAARFIEITEQIAACRDPNDDKFLDLAVCGHTAFIVTGDEDLLALHPFRGIPILSVGQFLAPF